MTNVVTSCSLAGWEKYGRKFFDTFEKHWPRSVTLHIVSEDNLPLDAENSPAFWKFSKLDRSAGWREFEAHWGAFRWVRGDSTSQRPSDIAPRWKPNTGY